MRRGAPAGGPLDLAELALPHFILVYKIPDHPESASKAPLQAQDEPDISRQDLAVSSGLGHCNGLREHQLCTLYPRLTSSLGGEPAQSCLEWLRISR